MNRALIIDTSIWVGYFRGKDKQLIEVVSELLRQGRVMLCGVVLCELLCGVRTKENRDLLREAMSALEYLEVSRATWELAGETSSQLARQGIKLPITDLVVAALAIEHNCQVFTTDDHFGYIPGIKQFR